MLRYGASFRITHKKSIKGDETIDDDVDKMNDEGILIHKFIAFFLVRL